MTRPHTVFRVLVLVATAAAGIAPGLAADPVDLERQLAREPAEVVTTSGRTVRGLLDGYREGRLHLRLATDGGEVGYSFAQAEIARLTWPGADLAADARELIEHGDLPAAIPLLQALSRQRVRYLPLLREPDQQPLWFFVQHGAVTAETHGVRPIVDAMRPFADTAEKKLLLLEAALEIALRVEAEPEVVDLATAWCGQADPAGPSARGWAVLAGIAYRKGHYDEARWIALQPVAFSGYLPMRDLDRCYALAVAAADRCGDAGQAVLLFREMTGRSIPWPDEPTLAAVGAHYAQLGDDAPARPFAPPAPSTARAGDRPALTFESVHKLLKTDVAPPRPAQPTPRQP